MKPLPIFRTKIASTLWRFLGREKDGVITGASGNDPAGVITYASAGATAGFGLLWTVVVATPLMIAVEEMASRLGIVKGKGLTKIINQEFGFKIAVLTVILLVVSNIFTISADLAGMGEVLGVLTNLSPHLLALLLGLLILLFLLRGSYRIVSQVLLLLTPIFFVYILTGFLIETPWRQVLTSTLAPQAFGSSLSYFSLAVAVLGATISPYLIFWQTTEVVEEHKKITELREESSSVRVGMIYSNLIAYFIILVSAVGLFRAGIQIETTQQAALALKPLVGDAASLLFSLGILAAGFLAIPILLSLISYVLGDLFGWREGLDKKQHQARNFYASMGISIFLSLFLVSLKISPVKLIISSQILNGLLLPPLLIILLLLSNRKKILGSHTNRLSSNILGVIAFLVITVADILLIINWLK